MTSTAHTSRYTRTAIALHWIIFLLIAGAFALGKYMADLPFSPARLHYFSWHKWAGVTIFLLVLVRLAWRATHTPPALPSSMPAWQIQASHALHLLLYVLIIAIPLTGWLHSSASGFQTVYFGVIPIPDLIGKDKDVAKLFGEIHETLNNILALIVFLHAAAALKHHYIDHDDVLKRILPHR